MPDIPEPVKVSPLIKFFRYSFLLAGIIYGASKLKTLHILEGSRKEERELKKLERAARLAEEKKAASDRDIAQIVAIFSGKPETESKTSNGAGKLETEEIKHAAEEKKTVKLSEDSNTRKTEEVKQEKQSENTVRNRIVEYESTENMTKILNPEKLYTKDKNRPDMFSNVFNLNTSSNESSDQPESNNSSIDYDKSGGNGTRGEDLGKKNEYFVETFSEKVPFAEQESFKEEFCPKVD